MAVPKETESKVSLSKANGNTSSNGGMNAFANGSNGAGNVHIGFHADPQAHDTTPECWVIAGTPGLWGEAAQNIHERCDLSGLSRDPTRYQLAATGANNSHCDYDQRKIEVENAELDSLKEVCSARGMTPEALILFAVHQTLKGLGGGSTTVSASLFPECSESALQCTWAAFTFAVEHTTRDRQNMETALAANANPFPRFSCEGPDMELVTAERLVKSGLLDIVVVFEYGRKDALLPHFPLIIGVKVDKTRWEITLGYDHALFDQMVIESILSALHTVLTATATPLQSLKDIELLSTEQEALLVEWNNTDGEYPSERRLHHLFEEVVTRQGDHVALIFGEQRITYNALNKRANGLAHLFCSLGIQPEQLVVLFLDKSDMMIATILGVWKSGAAHVPVDPAYPDERVRFVLEDTEARVIIASKIHIRRLHNSILEQECIRVFAIEDLLATVERNGQRPAKESTNFSPSTILTSKQLAYVTYTSGTTGIPKGIYKEHNSVVNSITDLANRYGVAEAKDETVLLFSAYVFEPFVRQMLMALTTGNRLAIIGDEEKFDPDTLLSFLKKHEVTYLNGTASVLLEYDFASCSSLKRIILVGETLTDARYQALRQRFRGRIFNEYGFTESAFVTALKVFEPTSTRTDMSLGRPVRNVKCYILDSDLKRVPIGVTGDLYVGGLGISRGYMSRPELTRQKFLANPFQTAQENSVGVNGLMYKTGDLARWLPNGEIEYLGRADFQIKLRGIRIEPGEIESNLATYPGVRASIVVSKKLLSQGKETTQDHLVGYYVCERCSVAESDLTAFLELKLPRYMIPTRLIQLQSIPVTVNGKADLRALPAVEVVAGLNGSSGRPLDEMETQLAQIWSDILRVNMSSIHSDSSFFRLGGHSVTCIQLIARVRRQLQKSITLGEIFQTKTLAHMSDLLRSQIQASTSKSNSTTAQPHANGINGNHAQGTTERRLQSHQYAANSLQQGFVYHSLKLEKTDAYIMQSLLHYAIKLDVKRYRDAWAAVQRQNPALRVRFAWEGEVSQIIEPSLSLEWRIVDFRHDEGDQNDRVLLDRLRRNDREEAYHLDKGPLFRVYFIYLPSGGQTCIFSCHHSIMDGWSLPLLFDRVHQIYLDIEAARGCSNQENTAYVRCQEYLAAHREDHLEFWESEIDRIQERCDMNSLLNEASRYKVPLADYDEILDQKQQSVELPWGDAKCNSCKQQLDSHGITLHTLLQLVWHLVLHSYGGGTHTITGTTSSGRHLPVEGIEDAIGLFINTLPLIVDHEHISSHGMTVLEALEYVQEIANAMNLRSNAELGRLGKADLKHGLFDSLFVLENYPNLDTNRDLHRKMLQYVVEGSLEKLSYPLVVIAREDGHDSCSFMVCYAGELFSDETIHTLLQTVRDVFETVSRNLQMHIDDFEFLSAKELAQLDKWNATEHRYPNTTLHALFEVEAQQKPDKLAVVYEEMRLTYKELNSRANSLAYHLLSKVSVQPNQIIALVLHKSEHMITNIFGIWKAGGAYVPIDPAYPDDRIQYILEDTGALAVITDPQYVERLRQLVQQSVPVLESGIAARLDPALSHPSTTCSPSDLAYIMYTSGTTGRPKGVMVEHHGVVNLCASLSEIFGLRDTDDEVILSFSNYVFDHFVEQMTDALLNGQTLVVLNDDMRGDKERLYKYMETNRVTYLSGTPSVISMYEFDRFSSHLRRIDCVGEAFSEPVFDKIRSTFPGLVINGYGPTEVSITTHKRLYPYPERRTDKSIGKQIANSTSYILDSQMKRVPIGAVGELYLGGDGVARGYHNRPDLTEERFPANPFQREIEKLQSRNGRLYKTGDLVRWVGDGEIEYLGRNDFQVKIRGQRIELGEIEAVLSSYPEIEQSVVLAKDRESDGQKYLVGYFVSAGSLSTRAIRRFMLSRLPDYMVPAKLLQIEKIPVTVSGKLDSKALPIPEETAQEDIIAPRTELEQLLANMWSEVLGIPSRSIGIHNDFFSLGGDSLKSTKFSFTATQALGVSVSVRDLFKHPTIEALSNWVVRGSDGHSDISPLQGYALDDIPVSPAQERLIFVHEFNSESQGQGGAYNVPFHLGLREDVCMDNFQSAIYDMIARHEALRTLFMSSNSGYRQQIVPPESAKSLLRLEILAVLSREEMEQEMAKFDTHEFCIGSELPIRLQFYQLSSTETGGKSFLSILFHHLVFDAWSWDIFVRDLQVLYFTHCGDSSQSSLPLLRVQYKEYAVEHRRMLKSEQCCSLNSYWFQKLADLEPLRLITDRPHPAQFDFAGCDVHIEVGEEIVERLRQLSKQEDTTLYTMVLSAFVLFLNVYTNQQDITIGIPMSHRTHPDFGPVVGFFVNLLPLRVQVAQPDIREFVRKVRGELLDAHVHQDLPFQDITKLLEQRHEPSRHPLVQVVFNWETAPDMAHSKGSLISTYGPSTALPSVAKFDLNATIKENKSSLTVNFNYPTALFNKETVEGFLETFLHVLRNMAFADFDKQLENLTAFDTTLQVNESNLQNNHQDKPEHVSLGQLFERLVDLFPDDIAVADGAESITYLELNKRANRLAQLIRISATIEAGDRVALLLDKGIDMVVSILAVWKAGAAYVPMDPSYPPHRISLMLQESKARALCTTRSNVLEAETLCNVTNIVIDSPEIQERVKKLSQDNPSTSLQGPSSTAYIIFTSGTTGKPKGVIVEHESVIQFRNALLQRYFDGKTGSQAVLFLSNYVFDFSLEQLSLSILSGNTLVIPPREGITHEEFYELAEMQKLSYLSGTPSVLQQIKLSRLQHLQMVTSAGEELQRSQYEAMRSQFQGIINNAYGITETTVYNIVTSFRNTDQFTNLLCDPLPGVDIYVLNDRLQKLPIDAVGELYIGGGCLARGYLNQDALTEDRFIANPFKGRQKGSITRQERLYKTGDMVRMRGEGRLEYLGRRDEQLKLRGFRIELSEVRDTLLSIPLVKEAAVSARYERTQAGSRVASGLTGYYTVEGDAELSSSEMRTVLSSKLPSFMVPSHLQQVLGSMPVTVNGKIDLARLAKLETSNQSTSHAAPRNELERALCQLWASILGKSHCGIDDDLFALGGDSISSLQLVGDMYSTLGRKVTIKDIFLHRTVRGLSENVLSSQTAADVSTYQESHRAEGDAPLTPIQRWFLKKPLEHPEQWNHCFSIKTPHLSVDKLQKALELLQERHDVLRMRLKHMDGNCVQTFSDDCLRPEVRVIDGSKCRDTKDLNEALSKLQLSFDLEKGPLYTAAYLYGLEDGSARIWCAFHHLIMDTVSWSIICADLEALYHGKSLGPKGISVQQWAHALEKCDITLSEKAYWHAARSRMIESSRNLPPRMEPRVQRAWKMTRDDTSSLARLSSALDASVHDALLVAVSRGLRTVTTVCLPSFVAIESHGREESIGTSLDVTRTVGWFTSMYPFEIPEIDDLAQGVVDVKNTASQVPRKGVAYGPVYGYDEDSLPTVSFNYLGRLGKRQRSVGEWALVQEEGYPQGLCTSPCDSAKSGSMVDVTFSIVDDQLLCEVDCGWGQEVLGQLTQGIDQTLRDLATTSPQDALTGLRPRTPLQSGYTPYFIFEGGSRLGQPLFLLPPGEGGAESYFRNIVECLPERNLVAFNNYYREHKDLCTIEQLAEYYLSHIRAIQPNGPYDIVGWSFGGILGLEIAARLANKGEHIRTLGLIDPFFDIPSVVKAIGHKGTTLDPIYNDYQPSHNAFKAVEERTENVILFKATTSDGKDRSVPELELFQWYTASKANNLDKFIRLDRVERVSMIGTHFSWVWNDNNVEAICSRLR